MFRRLFPLLCQVDVDLRCPVALKVISERYLGDESARLRFLREARAAARLRHSNVASVLHLGRTGQNYFYAMEFVEGETLENLIKRSGRLEVKLALEIATQVAAGLAAVHKQKLADEFFDAALNWFGDTDSRLGTAWEKGERLAKLVAHRRTLLVLDGLEPVQHPPGPQEGRVREPSLQALLRELAAFNTGLCVITTRTPVADIADHEGTSALRRDLEHLSSDAGAKLLRALGVSGHEAELRSASDEFSGHCFALTLLGSYLTDAYIGDIRCRSEVSGHLAHDVRQGVHARKVMESYQTWLGEGPELSVLRILGLFDRPADERALGAVLKSPAIRGLTESLTDLRPTEWQTILARLRRARLLAGEDPHYPGQLDTHPLVREYFGEQLRSEQTDAWKECNRRLFHYYRKLAPQLPNSFREMEPLFSAVICGCNAGLFRETLHEV
jgi:hypothetical protein